MSFPSSNEDYEELAKVRQYMERREAIAEEMLANGTLFGNATAGRTGPGYQPQVHAD